MEQSIKRVEDLPGCTINCAIQVDGCIYLTLDDGRHAVFSAADSIEYDCAVVLAEPDLETLARHGFISLEQLTYELREEIAGRNWQRVRELAEAAILAEIYEIGEVLDANTD